MKGKRLSTKKGGGDFLCGKKIQGGRDIRKLLKIVILFIIIYPRDWIFHMSRNLEMVEQYSRVILQCFIAAKKLRTENILRRE